MQIVYHSFEGHFSDSPRALYEALAAGPARHEHTWLIDPAREAEFPAGVELVPYGPGSAPALEAADLVIANTHTDFDWDKRPGTRYLQTWHGTPLKRIHWDVRWAPEGRLDRLQRDIDRWDLLLSPNPVSTPLLRQAFRYEGAVAETGLPRNDVLLSPERDAIRARVRAELGLSDDTTAVLYTPTWRDDVVFPEGGREFALDLDVGAFADRLGADHCLLLRLHRMLRGRIEGMSRDSVIDVSERAQVAELYLAADVLVTDYSSTMFDFAVLGRPILLFVPDLDDYEGRLRGFYHDFREVAPGPVLETNDALLDALADLPSVGDASADRYAAFRDRFCCLEDGRATERVLAALR